MAAALRPRLLRLAWSSGPRRLATVALVAIALVTAVSKTRAREVPVYVVERRTLVQRVVASGRVMPPARISLASLALARVAAVAVDEGDRVRPGQLLVRLEDAEARAGLAQARARVAEAAARVEQLRAVGSRTTAEALRQAELRVAQAERELERARQLFDAGSASEAQLDEAQRARDLARSQQQSAAVQATSALRAGADFRLAAAALAQAQAAEAAAQVKLDDTQLRAPVEGQVIQRDVEPGDVVAAGKRLLLLTRTGETRLTVQPDEKNLALLRLGQEAVAAADAFPAQPFRAVVSFIAPAVDPARGTVEVRLRVPDPPPFLRPDLTVSVNVEVARREGALTVPADAVRDPSIDPWVLRVERGRTERRSVKLGIRGEGLVEVLDGLAARDVVVAPTAGLGAGERVRGRALPPPAEFARAL